MLGLPQSITWTLKLSIHSFIPCTAFASGHLSVVQLIHSCQHSICNSVQAMAPVAKLPFKHWIKPEVFPLFVAMGTALSACGFTIVRNLTRNPDVRFSKEARGAGMLENYDEGEAYKNHSLRKYLEGRTP